MIDIHRILNDREAVEKALLKRLKHVDFSELITWHEKRKSLQTSTDGKKNQRKTLSADIAKKLAKNDDVADLKATVRTLGQEIATQETQTRTYNDKIHEFLTHLPNIPEDEVPAGGKENNEPLEYRGAKPVFDFASRDHVELGTRLGLVDFDRGTKLGGRGKWVYWGDGALLEWSLLNYFIDHHRNNGYTFVLPPHLLRLHSGFVAGQFPKFKDDVYYVASRSEGPEDHTHFLLPTSETALANLYADEVIAENDLPIRLCAYTPCYRREAGGYRTNERGTIRGNQFNKVEIFALTTPQESQAQFQAIVQAASGIMDSLGLHYRITRLAAEDCSASMAKTYDLEVWLPSIGEYKEVSSVSTAYTYQAIRGNIRYKDKATKKNKFVHTLNGSALATSRLVPAILEQNQQADGTVAVPKVLQPYIGKEVFAPNP